MKYFIKIITGYKSQFSLDGRINMKSKRTEKGKISLQKVMQNYTEKALKNIQGVFLSQNLPGYRLSFTTGKQWN
jgi:predicted transposase